MIMGNLGITVYVLVVAALLGLVMGSFINCWAWRSTHGESVLKGRSHCPACNHALGARDLVPVISWLASGRKCRYCGEPVSARYPATEIVCAVVFVALTARYGLSLETVEMLAFACILLFLSLTDLDEFIIPNECILAAIGVRAVYMAASCALGRMNSGDVLYFVGSAFGVAIALVIIVLVADKVFGRESMGGGDLKLYFVAALYFGWQQGLFLVVVSCIIGIVVAFAAPKRSDEDAGESTLKRVIPFGPSIAAACIVTALVGEQFVTWYLNMLL